MQALHITETRAIVPVTRKLTQLRFSLEDLVGPAASDDEESGTGGTKRGRLSARRLSQLIPNAVLQCQKASSKFIELNLTYEQTIKIPEFSARERRYRLIPYTTSSEILWRPETGFCFVMDLPRRAIAAVTWMLSSAVLGYPGRLSPMDLDRSLMRKVIRYVTGSSKGGPGELTRAIFRDVELDGNHFDEVNLRSRELHQSELYKDVQKGAGHIHAISFITPIIEEIGRPLACRMDSTGSVQIYSQRLPNNSLRALLIWLEEMLAK
ncbi:MAG: hypothetical protein ACFFD8_02190 [Candidatus Thorarchaeota archaeon]